jgi:hypothetical protein
MEAALSHHVVVDGDADDEAIAVVVVVRTSPPLLRIETRWK